MWHEEVLGAASLPVDPKHVQLGGGQDSLQNTFFFLHGYVLCIAALGC